MKGNLDWKSKEVVNVYDELTLWSAPFGRLLLENIPMSKKSKVVDLGFGTGFPLIELAQRFGDDSMIYGIDLWKEGIERTKKKIRIFELSNIKIYEQSAESIPLKDESVDLVVSNLGVNNFCNRNRVFQESYRVLKKDGHICFTTNPIGTFKELFDLFELILNEYEGSQLVQPFNNYINHRETKESIISDLAKQGFKLAKDVSDCTNFRFTSAIALLNHALIRIGFIESWENLIPENIRTSFFERLKELIDIQIQKNGEFKISVPMLYLEFEK